MMNSNRTSEERNITAYIGYLPQFNEIPDEWRKNIGSGACNWHTQVYYNHERDFTLSMCTERNNDDVIEYTVDLGRTTEYMGHEDPDSDPLFVETYMDPQEAFESGMRVMEEVVKGGFDSSSE